MPHLRALAILVVAVAACAPPSAGQQSSTPAVLSTTPAVSFAPTDLQTPAATETPPPGPILSTTAPTAPSWTPRPAEALLLGSAVRPTVAELNVRDGPSLAARKLGVVTRGNVLVVNGTQSFATDGYTWYHGSVVSATGELPPLPGLLDQAGEPLAGWIAVAKGATSYVERLAPRCPSGIDLYTIAAMLDSELLACFGNNSIVLEADFGCGGCGGFTPGTFEPGWLAHPILSAMGVLSVYPLTANRWAALVGHFPPDGPAAPPEGSVVRIRGHFDDERARECQIALPLPWDRSDDPKLVPVDQASAELYCRQRFVIESYEVLGTDPDFPLG